MRVLSGSMEIITSWQELKAMIANLFLQLQKVVTVLIVFVFGNILLLFRRQMLLIPMFMTCAWYNTKMDGSMAYFVQSDAIRTHPPAISLQQSHSAALSARKTS